jgi:hypothetical protein
VLCSARSIFRNRFLCQNVGAFGMGLSTTNILDKCLRDSDTDDFVLLNLTGRYEFVHRAAGAREVIISGKGTITTAQWDPHYNR